MKRVAGLKQVQKALENGKALTVYVAKDADHSLREKLIALAKGYNVNVIYMDTMAQLGRECGIAVKAAAAADICD